MSLVHRQQFDGGHAEVDEMRDGRFVAQAGEGPAQLRGIPGWRMVKPLTCTS